MNVRVATRLKTDENAIWNELQNVSSLRYVAAPILIFRAEKDGLIPKRWACGVEYRFRLFFFGIIPIGKHVIQLVELNEERKRIRSNEHSWILRLWIHTIRLHKIDHCSVEYVDEIELDAGILTVPVYLFALFFYRYRQYRWRKRCISLWG
ncbi:MAG: hypothetical protein CSB23_01695 [Deltaproteobacteria bacterium]|nr:MAG: hypothetical protein CSB23_01695 [Deltaproteobacteria bacterium]